MNNILVLIILVPFLMTVLAHYTCKGFDRLMPRLSKRYRARKDHREGERDAFAQQIADDELAISFLLCMSTQCLIWEGTCIILAFLGACLAVILQALNPGDWLFFLVTGVLTVLAIYGFWQNGGMFRRHFDVARRAMLFRGAARHAAENADNLSAAPTPPQPGGAAETDTAEPDGPARSDGPDDAESNA